MDGVEKEGGGYLLGGGGMCGGKLGVEGEIGGGLQGEGGGLEDGGDRRGFIRIRGV